MYLSKKDILKEIKNWDLNSLEELAEELQVIIKENSITAEVQLEYDSFKGSGNCTIAMVDKDSKKTLQYLEPDKSIPNGKYKGKKIWYLIDGYYQTCEVGNKAQDHKRYICVNKGEIDNF